MKSTAAAFSLILASICVATAAFASEKETAFECPDDKAFKLSEVARSAISLNHGFKDWIEAYSYVIKNASRPMDELALRSACSGLAYQSYIEDHGGHGPFRVGLIPPKEAVASLRKKFPIVSKCPDDALYAAQLPVQRTVYDLPEEAVRLGITGWVDLELDVSDDGRVESARIVESSNSILEIGIIDNVLEFRYPKSWHYNGHNMRRKGLQIRIRTNFFHIARERGCDLDRR